MGVVPHAVAFHAARDMDVGDGLDGEFGEGLGRVLAAVDVVGVQVGDVDEEAYAGAVGQVVQELALGHLLARPGEQRGDVLDGEGYGQRGLGDADVLAEHVEGVAGARHGQQVAGFQERGGGQGAARADERDVLGDEGRAQRLGSLGERRQPGLVRAVGAAEAEGDAVRDHGHAAFAQP